MVQSDLIATLVAAVVAAFIGGFIAVRLGLPALVGYLLAGVVIGPYTPGGSADSAVAAELADVGVILLLFGIGLQFSTRELLAVRTIALPGALSQIAVATALGLGLSQWWGWSLGEGLILGIALSVASTVVLLRALEGSDLLDSFEGHVAVGWLVVEDLFTVLVLVLLPALAPGDDAGHGLAGQLAAGDTPLTIGLALLQTGIFVLLMLFVGVKAIPRLLAAVAQTGSRELFTLAVLAIALGVAFGSAELFGASLALGAFLAGVVLNESELSHRAGVEALPLRDAFAVLFFVSVGMLFDPAILVDEPFKVLGVISIVIAGKAVVALGIVILLGYGIRAGLIVGAGLSQVGEFSFILVGLALALDVLPREGSSLILAAAIISISLNPLLFHQIRFVEGRLARATWMSGFAGRRLHQTKSRV